MMKQSGWLTLLDALTIILFLFALGVVFFFTPIEAVMGAVQKVFYFHVAAAWAGMLGFLVGSIFAVLYLLKRGRSHDLVSVSAIEISLLFFVVSIITGSIWARPIWNTWWTWDPRLTTSTITVLVYAGYLMLRSGIDDPMQRARTSAVFAVTGFVSVPLTFLSIRMFRTIHPVLLAAGETPTDGFGLSDSMQIALFVSLLTFTILFVDLLCHRFLLARMMEDMEDSTAISGIEDGVIG